MKILNQIGLVQLRLSQLFKEDAYITLVGGNLRPARDAQVLMQRTECSIMPVIISAYFDSIGLPMAKDQTCCDLACMCVQLNTVSTERRTSGS